MGECRNRNTRNIRTKNPQKLRIPQFLWKILGSRMRNLWILKNHPQIWGLLLRIRVVAIFVIWLFRFSNIWLFIWNQKVVAKKFKIQLKNYSRIRVLGSVTVYKTLLRIVKKNNHRIGDFDSMKKVEYTKKRNPKSIFFEWRIRKISNRISEIIRIFEKKGQITKIATTLLYPRSDLFFK